MAESLSQFEARMDDPDNNFRIAFMQEKTRVMNTGVGSQVAYHEARAKFSLDPIARSSGGSQKKGGTPAVESVVFEGKSAGIVAIVNWVAENLCIKDPRPEDAPSAIAWSMLEWAKDESSEFWKGPFSKLIPNRGTLEEAEKRRDDGRSLDYLEEDLLRIRERVLGGRS